MLKRIRKSVLATDILDSQKPKMEVLSCAAAKIELTIMTEYKESIQHARAVLMWPKCTGGELNLNPNPSKADWQCSPLQRQLFPRVLGRDMSPHSHVVFY